MIMMNLWTRESKQFRQLGTLIKFHLTLLSSLIGTRDKARIWNRKKKKLIYTKEFYALNRVNIFKLTINVLKKENCIVNEKVFIHSNLYFVLQYIQLPPNNGKLFIKYIIFINLGPKIGFQFSYKCAAKTSSFFVETLTSSEIVSISGTDS